MKKKVCLMFTGQGSQFPEMGGKRVQDLLKLEHLDKLNMTKYAQVGIFKVNKALMEYFVSKTRGTVEVCAVIGHSLGEYAALASFADVLSIQDLVETVFFGRWCCTA